ncbi:2-oxoglutarate/2-oxoacid ferredoxin oxidoreductase, beta subunit (EC / 2-oxoglutarate/2-oxoacid ferredoxin oxidoreductase, gamma subunit (EC [Olavius algarvensis associated proteobacterium Delta 3]|nr:2-oxoglutarate/2-oxoacid ferredoxin oxidoreductase, beta subunit (EC / 2-oxoglutarate/2-oxoacid ferredoxin oxidoreductase, gamma subunit (EC [Olavius algarvensis associated proteobacterium Delta 3]CAB5142614.1 2-oxoglutarate/2-oxoacid ferredoxin oxidoreductase, beta subunit (EC / 2-oxoglutarate/2-oxoacid ferredoxin oxidoreductase, gamma subunit (EC [Olavius algarvensis associated proteobacterium Delta 3]
MAASLLDTTRPPVFCQGCAHDKVTRTLDEAFSRLGLEGHQIVIVSDIGCSGLFDTFFHTHAMHGLHGRALTYATGLKMACPDLHVVVTMGDGGQGIGGAHFLAACRRNVDLTLLVLNNFNFGMTGGQFSATTPPEASIGSGFLNRLERPLDICQVASAAGAPYVSRCSTYSKDLSREFERAMTFRGFSVVDVWGVCPGRYTRNNRLTPAMIDDALARLEPTPGPVAENQRREYGEYYREEARRQDALPRPTTIDKEVAPPQNLRQDIIVMGSAGQRIITAGEILCMAGMTAGLQATQKNEYNITVLRGPSISEMILSPTAIGYTGTQRHSVVIAIADEGVARRSSVFESLEDTALVIRAEGVAIPECRAEVISVNFKGLGIRPPDWALAALGVLSTRNRAISPDMLIKALHYRFQEPVLSSALKIVQSARSAG